MRDAECDSGNDPGELTIFGAAAAAISISVGRNVVDNNALL
jgi:hypothetical protein